MDREFLFTLINLKVNLIEMRPLVSFAVIKVHHSSMDQFMDHFGFLDTRNYYKLFYAASGSSALFINDRLFALEAGDIIFQKPGERLCYQVSGKGSAYLCIVHTEYLSTEPNYLFDLFHHFPMRPFSALTIKLDPEQSINVGFSFESMIIEQELDMPDKKRAIIVHLQMILLQIQRAGRKDSQVPMRNRTIDQHYFLFQPFSYS